MDNNNSLDDDYKRLYVAFINAISKSGEIREIIGDLKERDKINQASMFALIIKLEELLNNTALPAKRNLPSRKEKEGTKLLKKAEEGEFIDGGKLSPNEIAFEEFCRNYFDEEKWLRENRLKF